MEKGSKRNRYIRIDKKRKGKEEKVWNRKKKKTGRARVIMGNS